MKDRKGGDRKKERKRQKLECRRGKIQRKGGEKKKRNVRTGVGLMDREVKDRDENVER